MKIALIGYGKMGKSIERIALKRGHEVVARVDIDSIDTFEGEAYASADVAIEFTVPSAAIDNYRRSWNVGVPVVSGTTGWTAQMGEVMNELTQKDATLFWASNFSVGVNIFFELNKYLAKLMNALNQYDVSMREIHHIHKKDAPSGTAITLAEGILQNIERKSNWVLAADNAIDCATITNGIDADKLLIEAIREGEVNGTHIIDYTSSMDKITIAHEATSREGFALGAVLAAEFTVGKKGFFSMENLMHILITNH